MRIDNVVRHLRGVIPKYTDLFTDNFNIASLTRSDTTVTAVTDQDHLLFTGDYAFIDGAKDPKSIVTLTQSDGIATATTGESHDLTFCEQDIKFGFKFNIDITGSDQAEYNGTHELLSVPNRRTFTYKVNSGAATPATGSIFLLQKGRGYDGWHEITVINNTTFTYQSAIYQPNSPALGTIKAKLRPRISGGVSDEEVTNAYTEQNYVDLWAFVVMGDKVANKDRQVLTDATFLAGKGEAYRQQVIQPFSIFTISNATQSIAARKDRDLADSLVLPFCKSLLRVKFPQGFSEDAFSGVIFSGDRFAAYNKSYYVHEYVFETTAWITYDDTKDPDDSFAFRDIELDFKTPISNEDDIIMTADIDIDEQPL